MFLITGAGRSGSTYITKVLQQCGLDVGHHKMRLDGIVCSFYCFEADRYPTRQPAPRPHFDVILHQVRHPLRSIASIKTGRSWKWTCQFLPVDTTAPLLERCCYNWLVFNEEAERQAALTYRIEALEEAWPDIQRFLGFTYDYELAVAGISKKTNTRDPTEVTWEQVRSVAPVSYTHLTLPTTPYV